MKELLSEPGVAGILLAAGRSQRFGRPKQLIEWQGQPLVRHAALTLKHSQAAPIVAVLGHRAGEVEAVLADLDIEIVHNPRYLEGQSTSVLTGLQAVRGRCRAALFLPCDQPRLETQTLDALIHASWNSPAAIIRPCFAGRPGSPVLFPAAFFDRLQGLRGDEGGRQIMRQHPEMIEEFPVEQACEGLDIDTEADLDRLALLGSS